MKKLISGLTAVALMAAPLTAFAAEEPTQINQNSDPQLATAVVTAEIGPSYIVTIPADTYVPFNSTLTDFGEVALTHAQLDPNKFVKVTIECDEGLNNSVDDTIILPYKLTGQYAGTASGVFVPFDTKTNPLTLYEKGDAYALTIEITENDWNAAKAGKYGDMVIFKIEYADIETN